MQQFRYLGWKGLFIDVIGDNIRKPLTICNIYHLPHDSNSINNISKFVSELSPTLDILQKENTYAAVVDDFNIMNEREKFEDFLTWCVPIAYITK